MSELKFSIFWSLPPLSIKFMDAWNPACFGSLVMKCLLTEPRCSISDWSNFPFNCFLDFLSGDPFRANYYSFYPEFMLVYAIALLLLLARPFNLVDWFKFWFKFIFENVSTLYGLPSFCLMIWEDYNYYCLLWFPEELKLAAFELMDCLAPELALRMTLWDCVWLIIRFSSWLTCFFDLRCFELWFEKDLMLTCWAFIFAVLLEFGCMLRLFVMARWVVEDPMDPEVAW